MQELQKVFCDTNIFLNPKFNIGDYEKVFVSIVTIEELDGLKKGEGLTAYQARKSLRDIKAASNVEVKMNGSYSGANKFLEHKNDNIILSMAYDVWTVDNEAVFLTDDLNLFIKAEALKLPCEMFEYKDSNDDVYSGYKEISLNEMEIAEHYQSPQNRWGLLHNEFLIIKNKDGEVIDKQRWTNDKGFCPISSRALNSVYFGNTKPRDIYQMLAIDSLNKDDFTLLHGKAGSAKTYLSLSWIMQNLHNNKITKCVIVFNPVKLKNNEQLGYYSGNRVEKLLQNSIGGILSSKLGDMTLVESLINTGKLMIVPTSDIRGIEISDSDCLYVTEAQNTDAYTMRTIIQRAKEGCKIIIEGDMLEQQDVRNCSENGMMRIIDVFKGTKYFSCIKLQNIYRSPVADLAQNI